MLKRITSVLTATLILAVSLLTPFIGIIVGADDSENVIQSWDFSGIADGTYTGAINEVVSSDGTVVLGTNSAYWNNWKTWTIANSKVTFTNTKYSSGYHQFVISFKLNCDLEKDKEYTIDTDFVLGKITGANSLNKLSVYYSPKKDNIARNTPISSTDGVYDIHTNSATLTTIPEDYTFTPDRDLAKDGYIHIRFGLSSVEPINLTFSSVKLLGAASSESGSGDVEETTANVWDFSGIADGTYTGAINEVVSSDGTVVLGTNSAYWNNWKTWTVTNSKVIFTNTKYSSGYHQFVISFKLKEDLKKDTEYTLDTDIILGQITGANSLNKLSVYYAPKKDNIARNTPISSTDGVYDIHTNSAMLTTIPEDYTFTPDRDLVKDGYIHIRFGLSSVEPINLTISKVKILAQTTSEIVPKEELFVSGWDFSGIADGTYTGAINEIVSSDGNVIIGANNSYWNNWKTWNFENSVMNFQNQKFSSSYQQFILSLKLTKDLKQGVSYNLVTDLSLNSIGQFPPKNFVVYYSPNKDNTARGDVASTSSGVYTIYSQTGDIKSISSAYTFTPDKDLSAGGYINIRLGLDNSHPISLTMTNAFIAKNDPTAKNKIMNGGFENGIIGWGIKESISLNEQYHSGKKAINLKDGFYTFLSQTMLLEANKNYELSFWYKGNVPKNIPCWAVSKSVSFESDSIINCGSLENTQEWKQFKTVFSSGENSSLSIIFQSLRTMDLLIDDITVEETDLQADAYEAVTPPEITDENLAATGYSSTFLIAKENKNVISNGGFENENIGSTNDAAAFIGDTAAVVADSDAFDGEKTLNFTAGEEQEYFYIPLSLEPEAEYYITFFVKAKATKWETDNTKFTNLTFGISDPYTGKFVNGCKTTSIKKDIQFLAPSYSGKWQMTGFRFKTDSKGNALFFAKGRNLDAFFDNFSVFVPADGVEYTPPMKNLEKPTVVKNSPKLLGVKDESYNLLKNYDLSDGEAFWSDVTGSVYGDTLSVVDSKHSIQGKALYYKSNRRYAGGTYYIKWIEVKPGTKYTFSAKYLIATKGNGFFGLVGGYNSNLYSFMNSAVTPTLINKFDFTDKSFDNDYNWQTVGITINTKDYNRIGVVVCDDGGEAYFDDLRLFETKDAVALNDPADKSPNKLVPNNSEINVNKAYIYGVSQKTSLSKLISTFKNNDLIRVYDKDGREVTDLKNYSATGMEIRLMNGPVVKARATVIIKGDVNGDGLVDNKDKAIILKHLSVEEPIDYEPYIKAADYDNDSAISAHDLLFVSKTPILSNGVAKAEGPSDFDSGDKIEITLSLDKDNIKALSGKLRFNSEKMTFESIDTNIKDWKLSHIKGNGEIYFATAKFGDAVSVNGKVIVTLTFKVGNITSYSDAVVDFYELLYATDAKMFSSSVVFNNDNQDLTNDLPDSNTGNQTITDIEYENIEVEVENRLAVLELEEAEISPTFDPEIKEYTATVPFTVERVTVTAVAENEEATVSIGDTNLEFVGKNKVDITVLSKEGLKRTYRIIITREPPAAQHEAGGGFPIWAIALIGGGAILLIGAAILSVVLIKRRKKS